MKVGCALVHICKWRTQAVSSERGSFVFREVNTISSANVYGHRGHSDS